MNKNKKILILGACTNIKFPEKTGGVIVLFENLKKELNDLNIEYLLIDTNKSNYPNMLVAISSIIYNIFKKGKGASHISLHGTSKDYTFLTKFVYLSCKINKINYSLRKFAGDFDTHYKNASSSKKRVIKFVLKNSKHNFFETKNLTDYFSKFNENTHWFPNVRESQSRIFKEKKFKKKFVFISQLFKTKGVTEILEASNNLPDDYQIDLYGPIKDEVYTDEFFKKYKANYMGALKSDEVLETLKKYDVLLLPTYYKGEGYPGIIIEAFSTGIPVITTSWRSIPEIVTDKTGVIIEPKSSKALTEAILSFNDKNYKEFSKNSFESFETFDSKIQTKKFLETIEVL